MTLIRAALLALAGLTSITATAVSAGITVDGTRDAAYGAAKSVVAEDPNAPTSNFGNPSNSATVGYSVYLTSDANNVYGFLETSNPNALPFANLYFDLDPAAKNGSDLGFELGNGGATAFIPGKNGMAGFSTSVPSADYQFVAGSSGIEFSLANSLFSQPIPGLAYYTGQTFPANGESVVLRLSQSFGYSVAGGQSYGADRLGSVMIASGVPEAATWALMIVGFGAVGAAVRRKTGKSGQAVQARLRGIA